MDKGNFNEQETDKFDKFKSSIAKLKPSNVKPVSNLLKYVPLYQLHMIFKIVLESVYSLIKVYFIKMVRVKLPVTWHHTHKPHMYVQTFYRGPCILTQVLSKMVCISIGYCSNWRFYVVLETWGMFHNHQGRSLRWLWNNFPTCITRTINSKYYSQLYYYIY